MSKKCSMREEMHTKFYSETLRNRPLGTADWPNASPRHNSLGLCCHRLVSVRTAS
jgi:hypothetical protein